MITEIQQAPQPAEEMRAKLAELFNLPVPEGFVLILLEKGESPLIRTDAPGPTFLLNMLIKCAHAITDDMATAEGAEIAANN